MNKIPTPSWGDIGNLFSSSPDISQGGVDTTGTKVGTEDTANYGGASGESIR